MEPKTPTKSLDLALIDQLARTPIVEKKSQVPDTPTTTPVHSILKVAFYISIPLSMQIADDQTLLFYESLWLKILFNSF